MGLFWQLVWARDQSQNLRVGYRSIEMHQYLWQCFNVMANNSIQITSWEVLILTVLLFATVAAGVPLAEVHSHANASYGHAHDLHDHDAGDESNANYIPNSGDPGQLHFHDAGVQSLTMLVFIDIAPARCGKSSGATMPPATRPPDNPITRLYRPPIA